VPKARPAVASRGCRRESPVSGSSVLLRYNFTCPNRICIVRSARTPHPMVPDSHRTFEAHTRKSVGRGQKPRKAAGRSPTARRNQRLLPAASAKSSRASNGSGPRLTRHCRRSARSARSGQASRSPGSGAAHARLSELFVVAPTLQSSQREVAHLFHSGPDVPACQFRLAPTRYQPPARTSRIAPVLIEGREHLLASPAMGERFCRGMRCLPEWRP